MQPKMEEQQQCCKSQFWDFTHHVYLQTTCTGRITRWASSVIPPNTCGSERPQNPPSVYNSILISNAEMTSWKESSRNDCPHGAPSTQPYLNYYCVLVITHKEASEHLCSGVKRDSISRVPKPLKCLVSDVATFKILFRVQTQRLAKWVYQQYLKILIQKSIQFSLQWNTRQLRKCSLVHTCIPWDHILGKNIQRKPTTEAKWKSKFSWNLCSI